jgi:hypothetical protein
MVLQMMRQADPALGVAIDSRLLAVQPLSDV